MMWKRIDKVVNGFSSALSVLSVLVIVVLGLCQVLFRFVLKISVPWTEELMRALYIYLVYFGVILVERENGQIRTTLLIETFPPKLHTAWETVVSLFSILFNLVVLIGSVIAMNDTVTYLGALPKVSMKLFFIPLIIASPLMILYQLYHMAARFMRPGAAASGKGAD